MPQKKKSAGVTTEFWCIVFLPHRFFFAAIIEEIGWTCWSFRITPGMSVHFSLEQHEQTRIEKTTNISHFFQPMFKQSMSRIFFINQTLYPPPVEMIHFGHIFSQIGWKPPLFGCNFSLTIPALVSERYSRPNGPYVSAPWVAWKRHCWGWWLSQIKSWGSNLPETNQSHPKHQGWKMNFLS